ncbi:hypothetical protein [Demequina sp.]|uniref:arsenate reductase/protein-tyrosine-phosphatase family protein n=1 Tax=Demequina sp. TaxID=2050685 RepID=UPI003A870F04
MIAPGTPFRVLLIDHEGQGRAPAGELLLRRELESRGIGPDLIEVTSAGLSGESGQPVYPIALEVLAGRGVDASAFRSRAVTRKMVAHADIIICGERTARDRALARFPSAAKRIFSLSEIFYLYEHIVAIGPLREHPALLSNRLEGRELDDDFDLPTEDEQIAQAPAIAHQIERSAFWIATIWQAMLPATPDQMPDVVKEDHLKDLWAFGVSVRVVCHGDTPWALAMAVDVAWKRLLAATPHDEPEVVVPLAVIEDPEAAAAARAEGWLVYATIENAMHFLSSAVTVRAIDARAGRMLMLHAAGLADADGNVVAFVAPSGTGKTTLARTLGQHYGYVTDETLAVQFDGSVVPYPKPLSLITDPSKRIKTQAPAEDFELVKVPDHLRLARIVLLDRGEDAPPVPSVTRMPLLLGLTSLAEQTSYLPRLPRMLHTLAELVENAGGIWKVSYRQVEQLAPLVPLLASGSDEDLEAFHLDEPADGRISGAFERPPLEEGVA